MARKSAGPGTAAAVAEARKVDTLGPRINREAKSSSASFQAKVAAVFDAFDRDERSVGIFPAQSGAAASLGGER